MAEPTLSPQLQQQLQTLQALNQNLQAAMQQRAQFEGMKAETEQALEAMAALDAGATVYRSVGAILVQDKKSDAETRLKDDAETLQLRVDRLQKQETQLKEQMGTLQQKLQAAMGKA